MPVTNLVANLSIRSRCLISAARFGEQAGIPYSRCGRTKAPYKGMKTDFERSWKELRISAAIFLIGLQAVNWQACAFHRVFPFAPGY